MSLRTQRNSLPLMHFEWKRQHTELEWFELLRDDFDDAAIATYWNPIHTDANRTLVEAAGVLTAGINGVTANFWYNGIQSPILYRGYPLTEIGCGSQGGYPCKITTKLNSYAINANTFAGILIAAEQYIDDVLWIKFENGRIEPNVGETIRDANGAQGDVREDPDNPGQWEGYLTSGSWATNDAEGYMCLENKTANLWHGFSWCKGSDHGASNLFLGRNDTLHDFAYAFGMRYRTAGVGGPDLQLRYNAGVFDYDSDNTLPVWLQIQIDASEVVTFWYSYDGTSYTQYEHGGGPYSMNLTDIYGADDGIVIGLIGMTSGANNLSAPFEFFTIDYYGEQLTDDCVAPIDTRAPTNFYDGRILRLSTLKRSIDDKTGLFQVADMSVVLANHDGKYSERLVTHQLKNREVNLYHAWSEEPEANRSHIITLVVDDYSLKGTEFTIKMKDITQKYFKRQIPAGICTTENYPWIHPDHVGRAAPIILGHCELSMDYEHPGAIEAVYVNTTGPTFWCLAAVGTVTIPADEVWIADVQKIEGTHYNVVYQPDILTGITHTYIQFLAGQDPGDDTVAFNANGYTYAAWDSANGYIQNLAYIIEYYLRFILEVPVGLIDTAAFDTLATQYEQDGLHEAGYLIIDEEQSALEILRQLLFTGGAKGWITKEGAFTVARKDIGNWQVTSLDSHIFDQIDLFGSPNRMFNLPDAINEVNAQFGYIPWQQLFTGAREEYVENFLDWRRRDDIVMDRRRRRRI